MRLLSLGAYYTCRGAVIRTERGYTLVQLAPRRDPDACRGCNACGGGAQTPMTLRIRCSSPGIGLGDSVRVRRFVLSPAAAAIGLLLPLLTMISIAALPVWQAGDLAKAATGAAAGLLLLVFGGICIGHLYPPGIEPWDGCAQGKSDYGRMA